MAESSSKPGIFAKAQKTISRTKTKVLQNLGRAEKTTDDTFTDNVLKIDKQQEVAHHLQKELKAYVHCIKDLCQTSKSLQAAIQETYETEWTEEASFKSHLQASELLYTDFLQNVQDTAMVPLHTYLMSFPVLKNKIAKRGRKMVDYDNARHNLETLQIAKKKDEIKIQKAQDDLKEAKKIYEDLNNELHMELPDFYNSRVSFYAELFTSLFGAEQKFHTELGKSNGSLSDISQELGKEYSSFVYMPKRPLSKSLSTNSENGLNGDTSAISSPSSPGFATSPSVLHSTSPGSIKGDSSQPTYTNDSSSDMPTLQYFPRRKAPVAPRLLQRIDEEKRIVGSGATSVGAASCVPVAIHQEGNSPKTNSSISELKPSADPSLPQSSSSILMKGVNYLLTEETLSHRLSMAAEQSNEFLRLTEICNEEKQIENDKNIVSPSATLLEVESFETLAKNQGVQEKNGSYDRFGSFESLVSVKTRSDEDQDGSSEASSFSLVLGDTAVKIKQEVMNVSRKLIGSHDQNVGKRRCPSKESFSSLKKASNVFKKKIFRQDKSRQTKTPLRSNESPCGISIHDTWQSRPTGIVGYRKLPSKQYGLLTQQVKNDTRVDINRIGKEENSSKGHEVKKCNIVLDHYDEDAVSREICGEEKGKVSEGECKDRSFLPRNSQPLIDSDFVPIQEMPNLGNLNILLSVKDFESKLTGESMTKLVDGRRFDVYEPKEHLPTVLDHGRAVGKEEVESRKTATGMENFVGGVSEDLLSSQVRLKSLVDDIERRPLLFEDEYSDHEGEGPFYFECKSLRSTAGIEYCLEAYSEVSEKDQFCDYAAEDWKSSSAVDKSKYYHTTFIDPWSSLSEDDGEIDDDTPNERQKKCKGQSDSEHKLPLTHHPYWHEGKSKSFTHVDMPPRDTFNTQGKQQKSASRETGSDFKTGRNDRETDQIKGVVPYLHIDNRLKHSIPATLAPEIETSQEHVKLMSYSVSNEILCEEVEQTLRVNNVMFEEYDTLPGMTEELHTIKPTPKENQSLSHSPNMSKKVNLNQDHKSVLDIENLEHVATLTETEQKSDGPSPELADHSESMLCGRTHVTEREQKIFEKHNIFTQWEMPELMDTINYGELNKIEITPFEKDNIETTADNDVIYVEALASNEWTLRSFVRMLMPKTLQLLASHTKSFIDSCLHSDAPLERDLAEIRRICKEALTNQNSYLDLPCKQCGSSVDVTQGVIPKCLKDQDTLAYVDISHSDDPQTQVLSLESTKSVVPNEDKTEDKNLTSLLEDSVSLSVEGDFKTVCTEAELENSNFGVELGDCGQVGMTNQELALSGPCNKGLSSDLMQILLNDELPVSQSGTHSPFKPASTLARPVPPLDLLPNTTPVATPTASPRSPPLLPPFCPNFFFVVNDRESLPQAVVTQVSESSSKHLAADKPAYESKPISHAVASCEAAVEILDKHFHSVLKEIVAKGSSNLKKCSRPPQENHSTFFSVSLHDTILCRLQSSVPMIDKPISHDSDTSSRPISNTSVLSASDNGSWSSPRESQNAQIRITGEKAYILDYQSSNENIEDVSKSINFDMNRDVFDAEETMTFVDTHGSFGSGLCASKLLMHVSDRQVNEVTPIDYNSLACNNQGRSMECQTSELKQSDGEVEGRRSRSDCCVAENTKLVSEGLSTKQDASFIRHLERSLASRRAAFSQRGSEDNMTLASSPGNSDHCSHASSDHWLFEWSRKATGSCYNWLFELPGCQKKDTETCCPSVYFSEAQEERGGVCLRYNSSEQNLASNLSVLSRTFSFHDSSKLQICSKSKPLELVLSPTLTVDVRRDNFSPKRPVQREVNLLDSSSDIMCSIRGSELHGSLQASLCSCSSPMMVNVSVFMKNSQFGSLKYEEKALNSNKFDEEDG